MAVDVAAAVAIETGLFIEVLSTFAKPTPASLRLVKFAFESNAV